MVLIIQEGGNQDNPILVFTVNHEQNVSRLPMHFPIQGPDWPVSCIFRYYLCRKCFVEEVPHPNMISLRELVYMCVGFSINEDKMFSDPDDEVFFLMKYRPFDQTMVLDIPDK